MSELVKQTDFSPIIGMVVDSVNSPHSKRAYKRALVDFLEWYEEVGRPGLSKATVQKYKSRVQQQGLGPSSTNQKLSAIRKLASEAADNGLLDPVLAQGIKNIPGVKQEGVRAGNWLTRREAQQLLRKPDTSTLKGLRDRAILAVFLGCGLRRTEVAELRFDHIQQRDGRWVIVDIIGKRGRVRTVPMPSWCKAAIDEWAIAAGLNSGRVFRSMNKGDNITGDQISPQALRDVVVEYSPEGVAPHDIRRTYAKLAHKGGASLDQIQITLGHASIQTTERYLGVELELHNAPCDHLGLGL